MNGEKKLERIFAAYTKLSYNTILAFDLTRLITSRHMICIDWLTDWFTVDRLIAHFN